jgi:hypothetical protein
MSASQPIINIEAKEYINDSNHLVPTLFRWTPYTFVSLLFCSFLGISTIIIAVNKETTVWISSVSWKCYFTLFLLASATFLAYFDPMMNSKITEIVKVPSVASRVLYYFRNVIASKKMVGFTLMVFLGLPAFDPIYLSIGWIHL